MVNFYFGCYTLSQIVLARVDAKLAVLAEQLSKMVEYFRSKSTQLNFPSKRSTLYLPSSTSNRFGVRGEFPGPVPEGEREGRPDEGGQDDGGGGQDHVLLGAAEARHPRPARQALSGKGIYPNVVFDCYIQ